MGRKMIYAGQTLGGAWGIRDAAGCLADPDEAPAIPLRLMINGLDSGITVNAMQAATPGEYWWMCTIPTDWSGFHVLPGDNAQIMARYSFGEAVVLEEWWQGAVDLSPVESRTAIVDAIMARTGFTVGGTWTVEKLLGLLAARMWGTARDKSGAPGTYEILDADDGDTVVAEQTLSATSPYSESVTS